MQLNLTTDQITWATAVWKSAVESKQSDAQSVQEYLEALFQPSFDKICSDAANSWKPADSPEVSARRDDVAAQLAVIPEETLQQLEAIIAASASSDDSDEVAKRRSTVVTQLFDIPEEKLQQIEAVLSGDVKVKLAEAVEAKLSDEVAAVGISKVDAEAEVGSAIEEKR